MMNERTSGRLWRMVACAVLFQLAGAAFAVGNSVPLSSQEQDELLTLQATSEALLTSSAGACRTVWDNDTQRTRTICYDPVRMGVFGAIAFGLLGGILGPVPTDADGLPAASWSTSGMLAGAALGFLFWYWLAGGFD